MLIATAIAFSVLSLTFIGWYNQHYLRSEIGVDNEAVVSRVCRYLEKKSARGALKLTLVCSRSLVGAALAAVIRIGNVEPELQRILDSIEEATRQCIAKQFKFPVKFVSYMSAIIGVIVILFWIDGWTEGWVFVPLVIASGMHFCLILAYIFIRLTFRQSAEGTPDAVRQVVAAIKKYDIRPISEEPKAAEG